jgi:hypothetical protein
MKLLSIISLGFLCSAEGFFPLLHVGLTSSTCYIELGRGHCVDANNKRLPHCHTTAIESEANCRSICNGNKGCTAYEWGQRLGKLGPYCQLIQPAGGDGVCPSGFAYTKTTATNPVEKTFHDTNGGKCFIKRKDASMYPKPSKAASMSPKPSKAASTSPKPSKDASMSERHYVHSMHGNMNGTDGFW